MSDVCSRPCPPSLAIRFGLANCLIHIDKRRATGVHAPDMANIACIFKLNVVHVLLTITTYICMFVQCDYCRRKRKKNNLGCLRLEYHLGLMVLYRNEMPNGWV